MPKTIAKTVNVPRVSCKDCIHMEASTEYPAIMYCNAVKMPMPIRNFELKNCTKKIKK